MVLLPLVRSDSPVPGAQGDEQLGPREEIQIAALNSIVAFADLVMEDGTIGPAESVQVEGDTVDSPMSMETESSVLETYSSVSEEEAYGDPEDADDQLRHNNPRRLSTIDFSRANTLDGSKFTEEEMRFLRECIKHKQALLETFLREDAAVDPGTPTEGDTPSGLTLSQRVCTTSKSWETLRPQLHEHFRRIRTIMPDDGDYTLRLKIDGSGFDRLPDGPNQGKLVVIHFDLEAVFEPTVESSLNPMSVQSYIVGTRNPEGTEPEWTWFRSDDPIREDPLQEA